MMTRTQCLALLACLLSGCAARCPCELPASPPMTRAVHMTHDVMPYFRGHPMFVSPPYAIGEPRPDDGF